MWAERFYIRIKKNIHGEWYWYITSDPEFYTRVADIKGMIEGWAPMEDEAKSRVRAIVEALGGKVSE